MNYIGKLGHRGVLQHNLNIAKYGYKEKKKRWQFELTKDKRELEKAQEALHKAHAILINNS